MIWVCAVTLLMIDASYKWLYVCFLMMKEGFFFMIVLCSIALKLLAFSKVKMVIVVLFSVSHKHEKIFALVEKINKHKYRVVRHWWSVRLKLWYFISLYFFVFLHLLTCTLDVFRRCFPDYNCTVLHMFLYGMNMLINVQVFKCFEISLV